MSLEQSSDARSLEGRTTYTSLVSINGAFGPTFQHNHDDFASYAAEHIQDDETWSTTVNTNSSNEADGHQENAQRQSSKKAGRKRQKKERRPK
ncbi:hypothetical protein EG329_012075 [Mollisiaceae sp. DMI_Dod_QoI]|nr:hypothetical protein EG329_012075 [Helotiales sp. DMI_Dod_QoI]